MEGEYAKHKSPKASDRTRIVTWKQESGARGRNMSNSHEQESGAGVRNRSMTQEQES